MVAASRLHGVGLALALALAFALGACGGAGGGRRAPRAEGPPVFLTLPSIDGGELDLASWRGRLVVVHFFTTSSVAADLDVAELRRARAELPSGHVVLLGVGLDHDGAALVPAWRDASRVEYAVALPTAELVAGETAFGDVMRVVPSTFVLDREGRIAWEHAGQLLRGELARVLAALDASAR